MAALVSKPVMVTYDIRLNQDEVDAIHELLRNVVTSTLAKELPDMLQFFGSIAQHHDTKGKLGVRFSGSEALSLYRK